MLESKYYTPDIKEFRVGFEYDRYNKDQWNDDGNWVTHIFDTHYSLFNIEYQLTTHKKEWFRVKYLDRQDIEELGFTFSGKSIDDWYKKDTSLRLESGHWINSFRLQHDHNNTFQTAEDHCYNIKIYGCIAGCDDDVLFEGIIKNKSELKELLEKLGILYNS